MVTLIACVNASGGNKIEETLNTAKFAHRAKKMETKLSHQVEDPIAQESNRVQMQNNKLRRLLRSHRRYTKTQNDKFKKESDEKKQQHEQKCEKLKREMKDQEKKLTDKSTGLKNHVVILEEKLVAAGVEFTPMPEEQEEPKVEVSFFTPPSKK
jgi:DNA anti-recombination protein RmuC